MAIYQIRFDELLNKHFSLFSHAPNLQHSSAGFSAFNQSSNINSATASAADQTFCSYNHAEITPSPLLLQNYRLSIVLWHDSLEVFLLSSEAVKHRKSWPLPWGEVYLSRQDYEERLNCPLHCYNSKFFYLITRTISNTQIYYLSSR